MTIKIDQQAALKRLSSYKHDVLGRAELANILGFKRANLISMRMRVGNVPPYIQLECGPIWQKLAVKNWITNFCRKGGK